jgi:hypothetical protein
MACLAPRLTPMMGAVPGTASRVKPLITFQGVLTILGLITGVAAILLPVGVAGPKGDDIGVLAGPADLARDYQNYQRYGLYLPDLLGHAAIFLLVLAVPISAGYLKLLATGRLAPWVWRTGYALAVLAAAVLLAWSGQGVFDMFARPRTINVAIDLSAYVCGFTALALGAWLVVRNRRVGVPHALNALIALQAVYVAFALAALIALQPQVVPVVYVFIATWNIGAPFALLTILTYVVQMVLVSLRKGAIEH